jgi:hypothetical protein
VTRRTRFGSLRVGAGGDRSLHRGRVVRDGATRSKLDAFDASLDAFEQIPPGRLIYLLSSVPDLFSLLYIYIFLIRDHLNELS